MRKRIARNISLPADLEHFVLRLVETGRYATASEVVRAALRLLERDEQLHAERRIGNSLATDGR